jgi:hypothetical protein
MQVGFMITNNGGHPPEKWADMTTETILGLLVDGNPEDGSEQAVAARRAKRELGLKLFDIFAFHHKRVMTEEVAHLRNNAKSRIKAAAEKGLDPSPHMTVMDEVFAALAATPWSQHFEKPEVQQALRNIIGQHTADVMHHEHRYHADRMAKGA